MWSIVAGTLRFSGCIFARNPYSQNTSNDSNYEYSWLTSSLHSEIHSSYEFGCFLGVAQATVIATSKAIRPSAMGVPPGNRRVGVPERYVAGCIILISFS